MSLNDDSAYDNTHRAFLQAFIARATLTLEEAKPILAAILTSDDRETLEGDITEATFNNYITTANAAISPFDFEIRSAYTQTAPRTRIYALVNTTSDAITQLATMHTHDEIAFVKRLLDEMFDRNNTPQRELMAVTSMRAIQLHKATGPNRRASGVNGGAEEEGASVQSLTVDHTETLLASLVSEGWLEKSREYYTLSPRALMELRGWLLETYNEPPDDEDGEGAVERIKLCQACREIVTVGQRCATRTCTCRLHEHCTQSFFRAQRGSRCPLCKAEWTGRHFVGEKAAAAAAAGGATTTAAAATPRRDGETAGRRTARQRDEEEDEEEEDDDDDE